MSDERKPFISCNYSPAMSGHFATMYCWSPQSDGSGFYEPDSTDFGRYETLDEAEAAGRIWAEAEQVEFIPVDREKAAAWHGRSMARAALVKQLRAEGMDLRAAFTAAREKYPFS